MGTRALTHFVDGDTTIATLYRQYDGYPEAHGVELCKYLAGKRMVNGFGSDDGADAFNGFGDLALRTLTAIKDEAGGCDAIGGYYLQTPGADDLGEEYSYTVSVDGDYYADPSSCRIMVTIEPVYSSAETATHTPEEWFVEWGTT